MRIKVKIEYDGTEFKGWQIQPEVRTVQGEIEAALRKIFNEKIRIESAGRTDAGVHAFGQVASFNIPREIDRNSLKNAINANTGRDILIKDCIEVNENFHARFSAKYRIYRYQIYRKESVFYRRFHLQITDKLDLNKIKIIAKELTGERDFKNLSTRDEGVCNLEKIDILERGNELFFEFRSNRFLRRMVRGLTGLLVYAGKDKLKRGDAVKILDGSLKRPPVFPPQGLILKEVIY